MQICTALPRQDVVCYRGLATDAVVHTGKQSCSVVTTDEWALQGAGRVFVIVRPSSGHGIHYVLQLVCIEHLALVIRMLVHALTSSWCMDQQCDADVLLTCDTCECMSWWVSMVRYSSKALRARAPDLAVLACIPRLALVQYWWSARLWEQQPVQSSQNLNFPAGDK